MTTDERCNLDEALLAWRNLCVRYHCRWPHCHTRIAQYARHTAIVVAP